MSQETSKEFKGNRFLQFEIGEEAYGACCVSVSRHKSEHRKIIPEKC